MLIKIPAFSMNWYSLDGLPVSDPSSSNVISAFGLALEFLGSIALFFRFSKSHKLRKRAAPVSTISFCLTAILGSVNLIIFGAYRRNTAGYEYQDGFFCAVFSAALSGVIALSLVFHLVYASLIAPHEEGCAESRLQARHFLITEGVFFVTIGIEALVFSRTEGKRNHCLPHPHLHRLI
jgi:potassium channel subfamily K